MNLIEGGSSVNEAKKTEDHFENSDKALDMVMEKLDKTINYEIINNHLEEIVTKVNQVQNELKKNPIFVSDKKKTDKSETNTAAKETYVDYFNSIDKFEEPKPSKSQPKTERFQNNDMIEGFENRINYASY
jgi:hypothetical protein